MLTHDENFFITRIYTEIIGYKPKLNIAKQVWISIALPKHRFIVWLVMQGRLVIWERKLRLNIHMDDVD